MKSQGAKQVQKGPWAHLQASRINKWVDNITLLWVLPSQGEKKNV